MCQAASFILTENEVYFSGKTDSHEDIIKEKKLVADGVNGPNILRVELIPIESLFDLSTWGFSIDQDTRPTWFNAKKDESRTRTALSGWWKCRWNSKTKTLSAGRDLDLRSLTSLPANAKLSAGGYLYLGSLTSLPANAKLSAGGGLDLSSLTSLPEGFDKSEIKGNIYLKSE
jgi:hypothetical protein